MWDKHPPREKEVQQSAMHTSQFSSGPPRSGSQGSCSSLRLGVVRNSFNHFQPSSSGSVSISATAPASHVESIGDSGIEMGNNRFEKDMDRSKAEKLWSIAKDKLGVSVEADDDALYIEKIDFFGQTRPKIQLIEKKTNIIIKQV